MLKFLSTLNSVCLMFIFGCSSSVFEKKLQFTSLKNTKLIHHGDYWLDISESGFTWPNDVELEYPNQFRLFGYKNWISAFNFYKKNGTLQSFNTPGSGFKTDVYTISEIVNVKITIGLVNKLHDFKHYITSFSAEMPH
ncbi:hypothetical protein [Spiroplasma endosymbiont of Tipula paludosa]|uniref:hypothetical protein n=1 Tax=Spiroplasma endosymbiont of Tipula paludosa TaxID=3066295 RepID=UPI0035C8C1A7